MIIKIKLFPTVSSSYIKFERANLFLIVFSIVKFIPIKSYKRNSSRKPTTSDSRTVHSIQIAAYPRDPVDSPKFFPQNEVNET